MEGNDFNLAFKVQNKVSNTVFDKTNPTRSVCFLTSRRICLCPSTSSRLVKCKIPFMLEDKYLVFVASGMCVAHKSRFDKLPTIH